MTLANTSRYNYCAQIATKDANGILLEPIQLGIRPFIANINYPDNSQVTPASGDTLHKMAWQAYGNSDLYWSICDFSLVQDPFTDLIPDVDYFYVGFLLVDIPVGNLVSFRMKAGAKLDDCLQRGDSLLIESLAPGSNTSVTATVMNVVPQTNTVVVHPTVVGQAIPTTYSRVRKAVSQTIQLTVPSLQQVFFGALDFGNPLAITDTE